jgi:uncharacterized protein YcgI (DUF1989 family)
LRRIEIPPGSAVSLRLAAGRACRVVNTGGGQVVDTWAFKGDDFDEYLSMEHCRAVIYRLHFRPGDRLVSNRMRPMLLLRDDTSPGKHDSLHAACSVASNRFFGSPRLRPNCQDNLVAQMAGEHFDLVHVPCPWNLFEHALVGENGDLVDEPSAAAPGDYVELEAAMDLLLVLSACPSLVHDINGSKPRGAAVDVL